jgi:hypothetical protein
MVKLPVFLVRTLGLAWLLGTRSAASVPSVRYQGRAVKTIFTLFSGAWRGRGREPGPPRFPDDFYENYHI